MWGDERVVRYIGGRASTRPQVWARVLTYAGLWRLLGFGYWLVEERATGAFVGEVGFADFNRDIASSMRDVPEAGWALSPSAHGKGYATEAVRAALEWADRVEAWPRTVCMIHPENVASIRVAEKCGYRQFETGHYSEQPALFFERTAGRS